MGASVHNLFADAALGTFLSGWLVVYGVLSEHGAFCAIASGFYYMTLCFYLQGTLPELHSGSNPIILGS